MAKSKLTYAEGITKIQKGARQLKRMEKQIDEIEKSLMEGEYRKGLIFVEGETVGECTVIQMEVTKGSPDKQLTELKEIRKKAYWNHIELLKQFQQ